MRYARIRILDNAGMSVSRKNGSRSGAPDESRRLAIAGVRRLLAFAVFICIIGANMVEDNTEETRVTRGTKAEGEVSFQSSGNAYTAPKITRRRPGTTSSRTSTSLRRSSTSSRRSSRGRRTSTSRTATWSVSTTSRDGSPGPPRASGLPEHEGVVDRHHEPRLQRQSAGYVFRNGRYEIDEIRDLPAITFRQPRGPSACSRPPNPLMPGSSGT